MAIDKITVKVNGKDIELTYNHKTKKYEANDVTPVQTSAYLPGRYYPVTIEAEDTAGNITVVNDKSPGELGQDCRLTVRENTRPVKIRPGPIVSDVYIKDKRTFVTKKKLTCYSYEAVWSIYDNLSNFSVIKTVGIEEGDFLIAAAIDYIGIIDEVSPDTEQDTVDIKCKQIVNLFSRDLFAEDDSGIATSVEGFIENQIRKHYTELSDSHFRLEFLDIVKKTDTSSTMKIDVEERIWSLKSFLAKARRLQNIQLSWQVRKNRLIVIIEKIDRPALKLDFSDPALLLTSETQSADIISRIDVLCTETDDEGKETTEIKSYYKLADGSMTNEEGHIDRIEGRYESIVANKEEAEDKVSDTFAKNTYSHLIAFDTAWGSVYGQRLTFYADVAIALPSGQVMESYISQVEMTSESDQIHFKSGELRTKLTDKLRMKEGV